MELKKYKLADIAKIEISGVDKKTMDGEIPVRLCNFVDVYYNWAITKEKAKAFMVASAKQTEIDKCSIGKGMVAITKDSETRDDIGIATYIADDFEDVLLGYHCALITPNPAIVDGKYLNAFMHTRYIQKYFENNASGSGQRYTLSNDTISNIPVLLPSIEEQHTIGKLLADLDRKIELNKQINDNLEAMAKQLYDYWFVQFDFPNEEGKPYKSSGGAMVWNEKLKREIPQGWGTQNLADCLKLKTERVNSKDIKDTDNYTPIEVIPRKQMSLHETVALENAMSGICRYSRRNILLSNRRVYFHKVCIAPFDGLTRDTVLVLEPYNSGNLGYLYETVFADEFILFATKHSYGSEQPVLSWTAAQKFNVLRPSNSIDKKYSKIVDSIIESVLNNQIEIIKLTKQRDELLPLLMNGQASVNYHLSAKTEITFGRYDGRRNRFFPILITISTTNIVLLA